MLDRGDVDRCEAGNSIATATACVRRARSGTRHLRRRSGCEHPPPRGGSSAFLRSSLTWSAPSASPTREDAEEGIGDVPHAGTTRTAQPAIHVAWKSKTMARRVQHDRCLGTSGL